MTGVSRDQIPDAPNEETNLRLLRQCSQAGEAGAAAAVEVLGAGGASMQGALLLSSSVNPPLNGLSY